MQCPLCKRKNCNLKYKRKTKLFGHSQIYVKLSSLSIASLRSLYGEANKFYDRKHDIFLFTRCYTQHALCPYIDSQMNHIRHVIITPFINKGIDFLDQPSIFRNNTVESSIPNYFENKESLFLCYKYNKPIRSIIFNFNKLIMTLILMQILLIHVIAKTHNTVINQQVIIYREFVNYFHFDNPFCNFKRS